MMAHILALSSATIDIGRVLLSAAIDAKAIWRARALREIASIAAAAAANF